MYDILSKKGYLSGVCDRIFTGRQFARNSFHTFAVTLYSETVR